MKYRRMSFNCHNNLDIYGSWEELKKFFNDNYDENKIINLNNYENIEILDWDKDLFEEKMEQIYYVFMTSEEPPCEWISDISKEYPNLEFNLIYQNREREISGEYIYKKGVLYNSFQYDDNEIIENCVEVYN